MGSQLHIPCLLPRSALSLRPIFPDPYSLSALLHHCSSPALPRYGQQAHAIALTSFLAAHPLVAARLIGMYSACCMPKAASLVFNTAPNSALSNRVLWTTLIAGLVRNGDHRAAMEKFRTMQVMGVPPNNFTLPTVLSACASERALRFGCQVHGCALRTGFGASPFVQSSLVGLYSNCSDLASADRVLQTSDSDDPVPWNTLIVNCTRSARHEHALSLFVQMHLRGLALDEFTFPSALNSAAFSGDSGIGRCIHCMVLRSGFDSHRHVANALVDMYVKMRDFTHARGVFDQMPERDVVTWTSLLVGHARQGSHEVALQLYSDMLARGVEPDEFAVAGVLSSCASSTALELGRQVHAAIVHRGLDAFVSVSNALITLYARSGSIDEARAVFEKSLCRRDAVTWTALIMGYAQNGRGGDSLRLYDAMLRAGARPDYVTFIGLIFACSHAGLVESGRVHFESMEKVYGITPGPEHYSCMVDLLGRSGRVEEAVELLGRMDGEPDATVWKSLLAACRVHRNIPLAERAAERLFKLAPEDAVPYVMLANVYTAAGRWLDVARVRSLMRARGVSKEPGWSWMEEGGAVHAFKAGDRDHAQVKEIFAKVREMMQRIKEEGYAADTGFALHDEEEEGKAEELAVHSERLAVAFGLINSASHGKPIRVYKNLRVCGDCHTALKLIAKVYDKVIILRDANCFHHMRDGICSCGDYW
ncbi:putative pentatricopeptide repeat-containing protein At5g52630 [Zingiber officinale]|uniref:DYW domain-containing protein n=1 Tax=Zingiber officinale TaxID=94328 RepID=A0A8J5HXB1_ZINOF|nr:putative pentatricopeptide repeat-containing protein At5g52630 [Zingiber officinale]KAG6521796.1 hypothetical protein ZIOFF_018929 [Zingiber officinale]